MLEQYWILFFLPLLACLILAMAGGKLNRRTIAWLGTVPVSLSALLTIFISISIFGSENISSSTSLWEWIAVEGLEVSFSFLLDPLALVFCFIITFVGSLILVYSTEFMEDEEDYSRFFAYMNLFVASMLILVLADNLLLLMLGWEGVGLCSYLLIGFWYRNAENGKAAQKAFIITRIGDTAMLIGLFMLISELGTIEIAEMLNQAGMVWETGNFKVTMATLLLLAGALGKSAQLPLQTWLPDAMAGPSPVSALIHAATMVTAGIYLIVRLHPLFEMAPITMQAIAWIGAITLLLAGLSALMQRDIKKVLAYSTISQIGYMFMAIGVGAWSAAVFHFAIHGFFKALLFLGAGVLIYSLDHEHDMFRMGGLRQKLPVVFWTFLAGSAALAAIPLVSAGFFSKDQILWKVFAGGSLELWTFGFIGALITAMYTFRMVFVTFTGKTQLNPSKLAGPRLRIPLVALAFLSITAGWIQWPHNLAPIQLFSSFIEPVVPPLVVTGIGERGEFILQAITSLAVATGIFWAFWFFVRNRSYQQEVEKTGTMLTLKNWIRSGWGFDRLYHTAFTRPYYFLADINRSDFFDLISVAFRRILVSLHAGLSATQNGKMRWYMIALTFGAVLITTIIMIL